MWIETIIFIAPGIVDLGIAEFYLGEFHSSFGNDVQSVVMEFGLKPVVQFVA